MRIRWSNHELEPFLLMKSSLIHIASSTRVESVQAISYLLQNQATCAFLLAYTSSPLEALILW